MMRFPKRFQALFFLIAVVAVLTISSFASLASAQPADPSAEVLTLLNDWRIEQGLWPLRVNATLQKMALEQAEYLLSLPDMPDGSELHKGRTGESPLQRALLYNWPTYGLPDQIAIGEIAAVGNPTFAVNWWKQSEIHTRTVVNPGYREIGIAALPHGTDTLFIIVMGGQPNILPTVVEGGMLYLSNEQVNYAQGKDFIQNVTQVRMFAADGRPLTSGWVNWSATMPIPTGAGDSLYVLYTDGTHEVMSPVSLSGIAVEAPVVAAVPTAVPTTAPAAIPAPTEAPAVVAQPVTSPDVLLMYDNDELVLLNVSSKNLDLTALDVSGSGISIPTTRWAQFSDIPLNDFPPGHCLQVKATGTDGDVTMPNGCRWLRSIITIAPAQFFWLGADFDVQKDGQSIATCQPGRPDCGIKLAQ